MPNSGDRADRGFLSRVFDMDKEVIIGKRNVAVTLDRGMVTFKDLRGVEPKREYEIDPSVRATVESGGSIDRRTSATRVAAGALLTGGVGAIIGAIAKKKVDRRELYLVIEADEWAELVELKPKHGAQAREFAQKINLAAGRTR